MTRGQLRASNKVLTFSRHHHITTTANIAIDDSCNRDGCGGMAHRKTQQKTEVVANRSLIVSQRDGRALLEGTLNRAISWKGEGMLVMG
jgi:hypothetical protein